MFVCDACIRDSKTIDDFWAVVPFKSLGKCEVCDKTAACADVRPGSY